MDDVSVREQHVPQQNLNLPVLRASGSFDDCAADRAAAAAWMIKKNFRAPPPLPKSSCMQVLPDAIKLGDQGSDSAAVGVDVTLALQLSVDRLENIRTLLSVWDGMFPILCSSCARFPDEPQMCHARVAGRISAVVLVRAWSVETAALLAFRDRIANDPTFSAPRRSLSFHLAVTADAAYPVNALRNIALDQVSTTHVRAFDWSVHLRAHALPGLPH
jgi:hypothetical protein